MKAIHNPLSNVPSQRLPYAPNNKKEAKESARAGGDQSSAAEVLVHSPNDGAKNAASIQGESWNEVEQSQEAVNEREILGYCQGRRDVHKQRLQKEKERRQRKAGERPDNCN